MRDYRRAHPERRRDRNAYAKSRRANPEVQAKALAVRRAWFAEKGSERQRAYFDRVKKNDPWRWRARVMRGSASSFITLTWLRETWDRQNGLCAISGRPLDIETVEVDHIVSRANGGGDELENLRLVVGQANLAKSAMTDAELVALCRDILRTLGGAE